MDSICPGRLWLTPATYSCTPHSPLKKPRSQSPVSLVPRASRPLKSFVVQLVCGYREGSSLSQSATCVVVVFVNFERPESREPGPHSALKKLGAQSPVWVVCRASDPLKLSSVTNTANGCGS